MKRIFAISLLVMLSSVVSADTYKLHSVQQSLVNDVVDILRDDVLEAGDGREYQTTNAPAMSGYIFTHWFINTVQQGAFTNRDYWHRALEVATYTLYETTTNTANYLAVDVDANADGLADGYQLYWYGTLDRKGSSDTDEDGYDFAAEVAAGLNPHFHDRIVGSGISVAMGEIIACKPNFYPWCTIRSEPESAYIETIRKVTHPGALVRLPMVSNGGVSLWWNYEGTWFGNPPATGYFDFTMPDRDVELVAYAYSRETDPRLPHSVQIAAAGSETDTLADEIYDLGTVANLWTMLAPKWNGYLFTHWSYPSTEQSSFVNRDLWGRALDRVEFEFYATTTNTANYLSLDVDEDGDGVPDGYQHYWYGSLTAKGDSDGDSDGLSFNAELQIGLNPHFHDAITSGGVSNLALSDTIWYNPHNYPVCTMISAPEGDFVKTVRKPVKPGSVLMLPIRNDDGIEWYWQCDGEWVEPEYADNFACIRFTMPNRDVELVAIIDDFYDADGDGDVHSMEKASGTSVRFRDEFTKGVSGLARGAVVWYNPSNYPWCTISSEPEGLHAETSSKIVKPGTKIDLPLIGLSGARCGWQCNGEWVSGCYSDDFTAHVFVMPDYDVNLVAQSDDKGDVDGDGMTGVDEASAGTAPIFFDRFVPGGVSLGMGEVIEADLQPFEQLQGAIVDGEYEEMFTSKYARNESYSLSFGENAMPAVVDVDGDGVLDLVVLSSGSVKIYRNTGTSSSPDYKLNESGMWSNLSRHLAEVERPVAAVTTNLLYISDGGGEISAISLADGIKISTGAIGVPGVLDGELIVLAADGTIWRGDEMLSLDTPMLNQVSMTCADVGLDGLTDILISDKDGRIWYYKQNPSGRFVLQYKVWAGTGEGFAQGLSIAALDWDGDGDYDLIAGRSDGKLMLLRDPKVGRPTNLRATVGAVSVVLEWDPNTQSRVRGYNVYRAPEVDAYGRIGGEIGVPRYRDVPAILRDYWYRVTALSRFYITGNTTPTMNESRPSESVFVSFGKVDVWLTDTSSFTETNVEVVVSMNNSMGISSDGFSMSFTYDANVLQPVEIKRSGLTVDLNLAERVVPNAPQGGSAWEVSATGGEIGIGAGEFLRLVFYVKPVHDVTETTVSLVSASVRSEAGQAVSLELPKSAKIDISDANPLQPAVVSIQVGNAAAATGEEFDLPFTITSTEVLTSGVFAVSFDEAMLELRGVNGGELRRDGGIAPYRVVATDSGSLRFAVKEQHSVVTNFSTTVSLSGAHFVDCNGFEVTADDSQGTILVKNSHPILPAVVSVSTEDRKVDTLETVVVPFKVMSSEALASGSFTVTWDPAALELTGSEGTTIVSATGDFSLSFLAKDQHDISKTFVRLTSATVTDVNGFTVAPAVPVVSTVLIHDAHPLIPAVVSMNLGDVAVETESEFDMTLSITSTEALTALKITLAYDISLLELRSGTLEYNGTVPSSVTLRFYAKENHTVDKTAVTITPVSATDKNGFTTEITLPASVVGNVILADSNPWQPATVSVGIAGTKVDTRSEFSLPVTITSNETLTNFAATVTWDESALEFRGVAGAAIAGQSPYRSGNVQIVGEGGNFTLNFYAKDQHEYASAEVGLSGMSAMDNHGLVANAIEDASATVVIHDAFPLMPAVVSMNLGDVAVETESEFDMTLSITSTEALTALKMALAYDTSLLELRSGTLEYNGSVPSSVTLRFYAKENHTVGKTAVTITPVSATDKNGFTNEIALPTSVIGNVILADSNPWQPATVSVGIAGAKVDTRSEFSLPVTITSNETLTNFAATVTWDENALEFRGVTGAAVSSKPPYQTGNVKIAGNGNNFTLNFYAKDQHDYAAAEVGLSGMSAMDNHGLAANAIADATATVVIHDAYPILPAEVAIKAGTVSAKTRNAFEVPVTVTSSKVLTDMGVTVSWDESVLELKGVGGAAVSTKPPYRMTGDGSGFTLTFYAKDQHTVKETTITLSDGAAVCTDGLDANVATENGKVMLTDSNPPVAVNMAIATLDARAESGKPFVVPLGATTDGNLAELTATVEWNVNMLTFNGADGATVVSSSASSATLTFPASGTHNLFDLDFTAKAIMDLRANTTVRVTSAGGTGANGLAAKLTTTLPVESTVLIVRNINKYDPGDIDGDGKYTDADMTLLQNYIKYLSIVSAAPQLASRYASWKLSGKALKAADVNIDGKVDANDVSMLAQFIASWKEANK